ncbi:SDR family oxidoreductase [Psychrobacter sp. JCM 18903]|uniref:SDR family NAD(P)-dependent oxidoreductase n=1 Tax=Psychrobacter sp. JCM 18903 TaxID=1298610 RepID=UPI001919CB45|nr:SDR family oxidoreductase [Psychrobacter sp. JCM 18903]
MQILTPSTKKQTIIVTGAAGGMGRECCRYFCELGWHVLAIDHNKQRLESLSVFTDIETLCIELDSVRLVAAVDKLLDDMPPLWGLVNLAGISRGDSIENLSEEDWQMSFDVNVTPAFRLIKGLYERMHRDSQGGSIINVSSPVAYIGARKPSYSASKAAIHGLTTSCARNLGKYNIRVNLLLPGTTITEMTSDWSEERQQAIAAETLLQRLCTPQEIAESIGFLLSEHSRYMTGSILDMTCGGMWGH